MNTSWKKDGVILYLGDCLEVMKRFKDKAFDMILCDLPYGTTKCKWDIIIPFKPLWEQYKRIIRSNGAICLTATQPFASVLIMSNIKWFKYDWIWEKAKGTGHLHCNKRPLMATEIVLVFYAHQPIYNPQMEIGSKYRVTKKRDSGTLYKTKAVETINIGERYPKNIIKAHIAQNKTIHPTQKPVALFEYLIRTYTNEGNIVLDNCIGSGTTAIACINTGRRCIGIEKDETYFKIAIQRISEYLATQEA